MHFIREMSTSANKQTWWSEWSQLQLKRSSHVLISAQMAFICFCFNGAWPSGNLCVSKGYGTRLINILNLIDYKLCLWNKVQGTRLDNVVSGSCAQTAELTMTHFRFHWQEIYSSEHIFSQRRGTGLPAVDTILFALYIMMRNWKGLHCVQPTPLWTLKVAEAVVYRRDNHIVHEWVSYSKVSALVKSFSMLCILCFCD